MTQWAVCQQSESFVEKKKEEETKLFCYPKDITDGQKNHYLYILSSVQTAEAK